MFTKRITDSTLTITLFKKIFIAWPTASLVNEIKAKNLADYQNVFHMVLSSLQNICTKFLWKKLGPNVL